MSEFITVITVILLCVLATIGLHSVIEGTVMVKSKCVLYDIKNGSCNEVVYIKDDMAYQAINGSVK